MVWFNNLVFEFTILSYFNFPFIIVTHYNSLPFLQCESVVFFFNMFGYVLSVPFRFLLELLYVSDAD